MVHHPSSSELENGKEKTILYVKNEGEAKAQTMRQNTHGAKACPKVRAQN